MSNENYFRLEFSEKQQWLRLDTGRTPEGTNGFITICKRAEDGYLSAFIDYMESKYNMRSGAYTTGMPKHLKASVAIIEFEEWKIAIELYEKRIKIHKELRDRISSELLQNGK